MMFLALDVPIPWKGLLLAYGAGQLAASLPITPGGLGVVEGSITVALVAFGGPEASTAYAVLLYRIISFWMILVIGWLFIGQLALQVRRGRWSRQALSSEVEAGPEAYELGRCRVRCRCRRRPGPGPATGLDPGRRAAALVLAASLLASCSSARSDLGTTDESCYLALPTAAKAVGGHGHLEGVRKFTFSGLRTGWRRASTASWPTMPGAKKQAVCLAGVHRPLHGIGGLRSRWGTRRARLAVAVVTTPANRLLGHADPDQAPGALPATHPTPF